MGLEKFTINAPEKGNAGQEKELLDFQTTLATYGTGVSLGPRIGGQIEVEVMLPDDEDFNMKEFDSFKKLVYKN